MRAPKKYLDKDRTEVNPKWLEWREEQAQDRRKTIPILYGNGYDECLFPEDYGKQIPEEGCWIRVLEEPSTVMRDRFRLPIMSIWRARRYVMNVGGHEGRRPQLAQITTPGGDLCLYPHEYAMWDDVTWLIGQEPDVKMHVLGGQPLIDEEQLFYLMKTGIPRHEAALLMLNTLDQQDLVWFEFDPGYAEMFGSIGRPIWRHQQLNPRESNKPFTVRVTVEGEGHEDLGADDDPGNSDAGNGSLLQTH